MGFFSKRIDVPDSPYQGRPIGRVLTKMGKVTQPQVIEALTLQRDRGGKLGEVMVQLGYITPDDVSTALAAQKGASA